MDNNNITIENREEEEMKNLVLLEQLQNWQVGVPQQLRNLDTRLKGVVLKPKNRAMDYYFKFFSLTGKEPTTLGLSLLTSTLLLKRRQRAEASSILAAVGGGWLINQFLKRIIKRPRPFSLNTLQNHSRTFSFPSAHTNLSVCYYGALAWFGFRFFKRPIRRAGWLLLILFLLGMIGMSRVYRKEHHPTDVLGGYLVGGLWLSIVMSATTIYERKHRLATHK